jgi:hypothetical protein
MKIGEITEFQPHVFSLTLEPCSTMVLPYILDEGIPYVWIANHAPNRFLEWWTAMLPLSKGGENQLLEVRSLSFDLQMPTTHFLKLLPEFKDVGIYLLQLERRLPGTLQPQYLKKESEYKVLMQNGFHLSFYLPHAGEYAQVVSPHRTLLEGVRDNPIIAAGNLP